MIFRSKKLSDLQAEDIQRLVSDQVQERDIVEYKRDMYGDSRDEKREMLKDITSMANHRGGYLAIGVAEDDDGIPTSVVGIETGNHVERITSSCLDNIDKRIVGLDVNDIPLSNGRVVIVISIPESINAPHMVTHTGLNQCWKRHGRQKDKMTIDEIGEAFDRRLSNLNRLDKFLFTRKAEILESISDKTYMVISSSPAYLRDEVIFDIHDHDLRGIITNPPQLVRGMGNISCGLPYPTINGLRANNQFSSPSGEPTEGEYIEVYSTGYIEYGQLIEPSTSITKDGDLGLIFASIYHTAYLVNFMRLVESIYEAYLPLASLVFNFAIYNAKEMRLTITNQRLTDKWSRQHLELGKFYTENFPEERKLLTKTICDRLWQAFHLERATVFDGNGTFITG